MAAGGVMRAGPMGDAARTGGLVAGRRAVDRRARHCPGGGDGRAPPPHSPLHLGRRSPPCGEAKSRGLPVTCDVTPHHLALTDAWVAGSRAFAWEEPGGRRGPRLRRRLPGQSATRLARGRARAARAASPTAPSTRSPPTTPPTRRSGSWSPSTKRRPASSASRRLSRSGWRPSRRARLGLATLIAALSTRPAAIIGEARGLAPGSTADLVLFDPHARWRVEAGSLASASANTPLVGMELPGVVRLTVAGGRVTYRS